MSPTHAPQARRSPEEQARLEDLARADCVPYDPGMKQDYQRRIQRGEAEFAILAGPVPRTEVIALPGSR